MFNYYNLILYYCYYFGFVGFSGFGGLLICVSGLQFEFGLLFRGGLIACRFCCFRFG